MFQAGAVMHLRLGPNFDPFGLSNMHAHVCNGHTLDELQLVPPLEMLQMSDLSYLQNNARRDFLCW